jgi:NAD+ diphosphatase
LNDKVFFFKNDTLLLPENISDSEFYKGVPAELAKDFENTDIFEIPPLENVSSAVKAVSVLQENALPANWRSIPVRQVFSMLSAGDPSGLCKNGIIRACHIVQWRQDSVFCGRCGAKNTDVPNDVQRLCPKCGKSEFPRICPAVIVVITDSENKILLAHNEKFRAGMYSHIAGFNEAGETLEETVVREIREEVNIEVKEISYIKSQPWPFPNSLMIGFRARYSSGTVKPDGVEIKDANWFTKDNLPALPAEGSLSRFLLNRWLDGTLYD